MNNINLFIKCGSIEQKDYIINILSNGTFLFQSFINLENDESNMSPSDPNNNMSPSDPNNNFENYGTAYDIYIDYTTIDIDIDDCMISILFYTHDRPPLEFCKKLSILYTLDIQMVYFNKENNYSGDFRVNNKKVTCDTIDSYYQGLYVYENNLFWETIQESFEEINETNFEMYIQKINIRLENMDKHYLKSLFDNYFIIKQFQKL